MEPWGSEAAPFDDGAACLAGIGSRNASRGGESAFHSGCRLRGGDAGAVLGADMCDRTRDSARGNAPPGVRKVPGFTPPVIRGVLARTRMQCAQQRKALKEFRESLLLNKRCRNAGFAHYRLSITKASQGRARILKIFCRVPAGATEPTRGAPGRLNCRSCRKEFRNSPARFPQKTFHTRLHTHGI